MFSQPDEERPSRACDDPDALPLPDLRLDVVRALLQPACVCMLASLLSLCLTSLRCTGHAATACARARVSAARDGLAHRRSVCARCAAAGGGYSGAGETLGPVNLLRELMPLPLPVTQAGSGTIARLVVVRGAEAAVLCVNATLPHEHAHELSLQALQALRPAGCARNSRLTRRAALTLLRSVLVLAEQPAEMRVAFSGVAVVRSTALPAPESARVPLLPCPMLAEGVPAALLAHVRGAAVAAHIPRPHAAPQRCSAK